MRTTMCSQRARVRRHHVTGIAAACALLVTGPVAVAQVASRASCGGSDPVGTIGISGFECDCTISSPGSGRPWTFRSAPKVTSLELHSPAGRLLKPGDVITRVNGKQITTREGAQVLANLQPGEAIVLTIRRGRVQQTYAMTAEAACPGHERLGVRAPSAAKGAAPRSAAPATPTPRGTPPAGQAPRTPPPSTRAPTASPRSPYAVMPRGSFGMGLSCSNCTIDMQERDGMAAMRFSQPPEVYSIERGGPADRAGVRRGDFITHINGKALDSAEGGRLFANVRPGEGVKLTLRRGQERKVVTVTPARRGMAPPAIAQSSESLERARASLSELQREQAEQIRGMQQELARSNRAETEKLRELQRTLLEQEREHRARLAELAAELETTERRMRSELSDSARAVCTIPPTALGVRAARTLRYTGTLGTTEIEVRGPDRVSVTESGDEVEIATAGTVIRLKETRKK